MVSLKIFISVQNAKNSRIVIRERISQKRGDSMLEIKGKINTAICYAKVVEEEAIEQIRRMCVWEAAILENRLPKFISSLP